MKPNLFQDFCGIRSSPIAFKRLENFLTCHLLRSLPFPYSFRERYIFQHLGKHVVQQFTLLLKCFSKCFFEEFLEGAFA